jgi:hypothetical protein
MKSFIYVLIVATVLCIISIAYSHLTYSAPANTPEWKLPGIADKKFVTYFCLTLMGALVIELVALYNIDRNKFGTV